ncbi:hypothetical protein HPP92_006256 [Vanilla planifolia]|uniref:Uncharacterized protein n=1 Tax=Vanilla planifolia TaxID=51239 RepID=A0A835RVI7_VANPL|nr:hypothetical protein HPP92_006256 [Vanilla planifolia]
MDKPHARPRVRFLDHRRCHGDEESKRRRKLQPDDSPRAASPLPGGRRSPGSPFLLSEVPAGRRAEFRRDIPPRCIRGRPPRLRVPTRKRHCSRPSRQITSTIASLGIPDQLLAICRDLQRSGISAASAFEPADDAAFEEKAVCFELRASNRESNPIPDEPMVIRSVTEICQVEDKPPPAPAPPISPPAKDDGEYTASEEEEDAEQFRRTIEAFIAKHRFRREEALAVVSCSAGLTEPIAV